MTDPERSPHIERIMELIEARFDSPINAEEIAQHIGRRPSYLTRLFREQQGCGIHAYLVKVRMREAARLIEAGEKAEVVALSVGYRSRTNFYRQFKKHFGVTPAAFRDRVK